MTEHALLSRERILADAHSEVLSRLSWWLDRQHRGILLVDAPPEVLATALEEALVELRWARDRARAALAIRADLLSQG